LSPTAGCIYRCSRPIDRQTAAQRTQELGVRIALGAQRGHVMSLMVGPDAASTGVDLATDVACTFAWERPFTSISTAPGVAATLRITEATAVMSASDL
jgi:hypothetical protein